MESLLLKCINAFNDPSKIMKYLLKNYDVCSSLPEILQSVYNETDDKEEFLSDLEDIPYGRDDNLLNYFVYTCRPPVEVLDNYDKFSAHDKPYDIPLATRYMLETSSLHVFSDLVYYYELHDILPVNISAWKIEYVAKFPFIDSWCNVKYNIDRNNPARSSNLQALIDNHLTSYIISPLFEYIGNDNILYRLLLKCRWNIKYPGDCVVLCTKKTNLFYFL